jgi:hypothetical protein
MSVEALETSPQYRNAYLDPPFEKLPVPVYSTYKGAEAAASLITKGFVWSKSHWRRDLCDEVVLRIRRTREWSHRLPLHRLPSL